MKTSQLESVEQFMKKQGSISPSHLSLNIEGRIMSFESFCRHLRTLHKKGKLEQRKIEKGRVAYDYKPFLQGTDHDTIIIDEVVRNPWIRGNKRGTKEPYSIKTNMNLKKIEKQMFKKVSKRLGINMFQMEDSQKTPFQEFREELHRREIKQQHERY